MQGDCVTCSCLHKTSFNQVVNFINETSAIIPFVAVSRNVQAELSDSVLIIIGNVRIELNEDISYQDNEKLLRSMICQAIYPGGANIKVNK